MVNTDLMSNFFRDYIMQGQNPMLGATQGMANNSAVFGDSSLNAQSSPEKTEESGLDKILSSEKTQALMLALGHGLAARKARPLTPAPGAWGGPSAAQAQYQDPYQKLQHPMVQALLAQYLRR